MSYYSKLNYISDLWHGDDSARISSFEQAVSTDSPRERSDHLLSLGSRLVQHGDQGAVTSNPEGVKRLTEILKGMDPSLLENVPCDYQRFNSTHTIAEVVLGLGDLSESPTTTLKVYEKMYSLKHPENCEHIDRTALRESKVYHAIEAAEIEELYASDNHIAVLEKTGIGTDLFNTLYVDRKEQFLKLTGQLEQAKQFKKAFLCYQYLDVPFSKTLRYANQAFVAHNYEEAAFLFEEAFKATFPTDMRCLSTFFTAFFESLERSEQRDRLLIILDHLLENHSGSHLLLDSLIYLPNLRDILFENRDLRRKLLILILTKPQDYSNVLNQTQSYLRDKIQTLDESALKDFKRFYLKMGITFYNALFQCLSWEKTPLLPEDIKWFYPLIEHYQKQDSDKAVAALNTATRTFGEKPLLTMIIDNLSTNPHSSACALLDSLVYLPNLESVLFQDQDLRRKLFALVLKTPMNYLNILSQTQRYLKDEIHPIDPNILSDFKEFYEKMGLALSPSENAYLFYEEAFQCISCREMPICYNEITWFGELLEFLTQHNPDKAISILKQALESLQIFTYQLPLNDRWLDISSYLYKSLLKLTPKDPHVLFCFAMQKKFQYLMLQKNNPTTSLYNQREFEDILKMFLEAYNYAKGNTKDIYLAAIGDLISDAAMRGFSLTPQEQALLKSSKQITAVYTLPDYDGEDFFEPIPDVTEHNLSLVSKEEETRMDKFVEKFKKKARVQDIPDDFILPSHDDSRFAIWETYKQISSYINDAIYPDFSQLGKTETRRVPDKTQLPSLSGNYGI